MSIRSQLRTPKKTLGHSKQFNDCLFQLPNSPHLSKKDRGRICTYNDMKSIYNNAFSLLRYIRRTKENLLTIKLSKPVSVDTRHGMIESDFSDLTLEKEEENIIHMCFEAYEVFKALKHVKIMKRPKI